MIRATPTMWLLLLVVTLQAGCKRPEDGRHRIGHYGWERAAKPNELQDSDLVGTYSCTFGNSSSTVTLEEGGTYFLVVRPVAGGVTYHGPYNWCSRGLDDVRPSISLQKFPLDQATFVPPGIEPQSEEDAQIGFNEYGEIVLGVGTDPDNYYYFARTQGGIGERKTGQEK